MLESELTNSQLQSYAPLEPHVDRSILRKIRKLRINLRFPKRLVGVAILLFLFVLILFAGYFWWFKSNLGGQQKEVTNQNTENVFSNTHGEESLFSGLLTKVTENVEQQEYKKYKPVGLSGTSYLYYAGTPLEFTMRMGTVREISGRTLTINNDGETAVLDIPQEVTVYKSGGSEPIYIRIDEIEKGDYINYSEKAGTISVRRDK